MNTRMKAPHRASSSPRHSVRRIMFLGFLMLFGGCGASSGVYGPAYVPECTCCCGGGYTPYAYKATNHSSIAGPPVATAFMHDTKGPMSDVSANNTSVHHKAKAHAK